MVNLATVMGSGITEELCAEIIESDEHFKQRQLSEIDKIRKQEADMRDCIRRPIIA